MTEYALDKEIIWELNVCDPITIKVQVKGDEAVDPFGIPFNRLTDLKEVLEHYHSATDLEKMANTTLMFDAIDSFNFNFGYWKKGGADWLLDAATTVIWQDFDDKFEMIERVKVELNGGETEAWVMINGEWQKYY